MMNRFVKTVSIAIGVLVLGTAMYAQKTATVDGVWNMSVQGDHVVPIGMELKQDGKAVTGKILMPSSDGRRRTVELSGEFVDGNLKVSSSTHAASGHADHGHDDHSEDIEITGRLESDGTMSGALTMPKHSVKWTAERLGKR